MNLLKDFELLEKKLIEVVEKVLIEFNQEIVEALEKQSCNSETINSKINNIIRCN